MSLLHHVQQPPTRPAHYLAPATLDDALRARADLGAQAKVVAGATDVMVELGSGAHSGIETLLDVSRIPDFDTISDQGDTLRLDAGVTHHDVVASELCRRFALPLAQACLEVGSPQLRNRATVVGNLVTASPANDTIVALFALGASIEVASLKGTRTVPVIDFVTGFRTVDVADDELVTAILVPKLAADQRGIFVKAGLRRAQAISVANLAAVATFDGDTVTKIDLALGSVAPTVIMVPKLRDAVVGKELDAAMIDAASALATDAATPIDDMRATADYRSSLVATMTRRALTVLAANRHDERWPAHPPLLRTSARMPATIADPVAVGPDDEITVTVNGTTVTAGGATGVTLLDWLRAVGMLGVKEGCAEGECGACTVHLNGDAVMACLIPAGRAHGCSVVTVEGMSDDTLDPVQEGFVDTGAVQCGFCTPGFVMSSAALLDEFDHPTTDQIHAGLAGNLCRCTGYRSIVDAVEQAATRQEVSS
ncbi:MAG: hypothetical protein CSA55_00980 [Ilumatobacter coccineus]|uniref:Oxidoreductase n=1 Tax=Ilumatobacter coccineus TaxID=467094 RepID=A0A2G6KFC0_9ACTN|nr:MAG: hypothetical protein CSA55_00980 [Ilumatobacter coccineus]